MWPFIVCFPGATLLKQDVAIEFVHKSVLCYTIYTKTVNLTQHYHYKSSLLTATINNNY